MAIENEAQAEDVLLAAFAPDVEDIDATRAQHEQVRSDPDVEAVGEEEEEAPEVEVKEGEPAKAGAGAAEEEEDYVEIPGEEGQEPTKLKVADLVASHQEFEKFRGQQAQILDQVETRAIQAATQRYQQVEQWSTQAASMVQATLQLLQPPQPPNADAMLNPASQQYDPDGYHRAFANYQRGMAQFQQAQQMGEHLSKQAQQAQARANDEREGRELERLQRAWPEFSKPDTMNQFVGDMQRAYGFTPQELDAVLTDHRQALVARDALAFRAMKAKSGEVKAKVEAKAPKLVRTKQEAKGSSAQARDVQGKFASSALANLKKTNSDADAAAYFAGLSKAGRI